ncbi:TonB-dependent receptor [Riemerella anatipestifer]|nr:TonB-dependent receptor [Riemerella anatipestifer]
MKRNLQFVLLISTAIFTKAQVGTLSGNINDDSKIALPGAQLVLTPGNYHTISDDNGNFIFLNVPEGKYTLSVDYIGYGERKYNITIGSNKNTYQNIIYDKKISNIKEVIVIGFSRQSQARALNKQRNNMNISNIVSSDQIGKFPDANIGDALKRIPGITMQNDQGEARNIIIRGLAPELNSVTLNGNRIPSAEGDNRNVQMDLIPSDMVQMIEVNKTLTPDQDADAIGGSVDLITKTASNKERFYFSTASGYSPIRDKALLSNNFLYSNRFFNGKLGWVLNGSYHNNDYGSDNVEAEWISDKKGREYISQMDIRKYDVKRERKSIGSDFDIKINPKNNIRLSAMYNWRDDWENRYRLRIKRIAPLENQQGFEGREERQTKGGILNRPNNGGRLERQIMQNYALKGDHILGNKIDLDWGISYAKAEEQRPDERYISFYTDKKKMVKYGNDIGSDAEPLYTSSTPPSLSDYKFDKLSEQNSHTFEEETTGKLNLRFPFSIIENQKGRLRIGGKMRLKFKKRDGEYHTFTPVDNAMSSLSGANNIFFSGENWNPNSKYTPGYFASRDFLGGLDLNNPNLFNKKRNPSEYLTSNYNAKEDIYSGYIRWDQHLNEQISFILGVRIENTKTHYTGNIVQDENNLEGTRTVSNNYINYLPNASIKYTPTKNLVLRGAYTTAIARPNYYRLSPFVSVIPDDRDITAGNPNLKAAYAHNLDVMGEYYFKSVGLISIGGFYKKINHFIYDYRDSQYSYDKFSNDFPDITNQLNQTDIYTFIQSRNGDAVNVYGFEIAFQRQLDFLPGFLSNLGIYTNYTHTKSYAKGIYTDEGVMREGLMLPGTAPHMFNASLSWENKKFQTRVSFNHTSAYLDELGDNDFYDRYYDKQSFLDINATYAIKEWMRVFVEANNLTNQPLRYYQGISSRTMQMEYYRPRYTIGLKFDF